MKRFWIIIAGSCISVAAISLSLRHTDVAFIVATLGAVAWFLNYRIQLKESLAASETIGDKEIEDSDEE